MLGDSRSGKFAENILGFGRTLRRAGLNIDPSRIALATQAADIVGVSNKADLQAALESVMVSEEQDRIIFRDLFAAYFKDPQLANKLLSQLLPSAEGKAEPKTKPRVREALAPQKAFGNREKRDDPEQKIDFDAAMTAGDHEALRHADFNTLSASEYRLVERLVRDIRIDLPTYRSRRYRSQGRGLEPNWRQSIRMVGRLGGELSPPVYRKNILAPVPILIFVDVSGSMERYSRLLLSFLHASLRHYSNKHVFVFGTHLTDLNSAFGQPDTDKMLQISGSQINDFASGTRLGDSLSELREKYSRLMVGRRTLVLLVSDGLDTGEKAHLQAQMQWLQLHCGQILWLNPLLRFDGYAPVAQGATVLNRFCHKMLAVHNISKLESLAKSIRQLLG